jgi:hypothetical protein
MKTQKTQEARKPLGWTNNFDIVLSKKKCPPGNNIPKKYKDDFMFVGRQIIDVKSVNIMKYANVRKELVKNDLVEELVISFNQQKYLHDQFPPIVILDSKQASGNIVDDYALLAGNNRFAAIKKIQGFNTMMVDVYRCNNDKALSTVACTTNHHRAPSKVMSRKDYIKVGMTAAWGTSSQKPFLGSKPTWDIVREYVDEIVSNMMSEHVKDGITTTIMDGTTVRGEQFQPYALSSIAADSINSVELFAKGDNPNFLSLKIPYGGHEHLLLPDNTIEDYGYVMDNAQGIKDKLGLGIRKYNKGNGKKKVLFYIFIMSKKATEMSGYEIDEARQVALEKYRNELDEYAKFISSMSGMDKDEVDFKLNNIFKLVGFLPHKIGKDSEGNQLETTIVNEVGEPVHHLTGELL